MVNFLVVSLVVTLCVFVLVDRICTCFEKCCSNRAYSDIYKEAVKNEKDKN